MGIGTGCSFLVFNSPPYVYYPMVSIAGVSLLVLFYIVLRMMLKTMQAGTDQDEADANYQRRDLSQTVSKAIRENLNLEKAQKEQKEQKDNKPEEVRTTGVEDDDDF